MFVRATKLPRWIPFTIVKGGPQANTLVKAMGGNVSVGFYSQTLINNIGEVCFQPQPYARAFRTDNGDIMECVER